MNDCNPTPTRLALIVLGIVAAFAIAGAGDYEDAVAQENATLKDRLAAEKARCEVLENQHARLRARIASSRGTDLAPAMPGGHP